MQNSNKVLIAENLWWPFGAHLLHMKWAYIHSLIHGYDFFYKYNNQGVFIDGTVDYYYESISNVDENELCNRIKVEYGCRNENLSENERGHFVPVQYQNATDFHSSILKTIYRPTISIQRIINDNSLVKKIKSDSIKYIALHIRLGDKISGPAKETNYIPIEEYFNKCKEVKDLYGINTIVVCSDTSDGLEKIISLNTKNEFQILFNDEYRSRNVWNESIVQKVNMGYNDKTQLEIEYLNCFINYELLLNSEIIIGNWDSGFCLVPVEMRNNKKDINVNNNAPIWGVHNKI